MAEKPGSSAGLLGEMTRLLVLLDLGFMKLALDVEEVAIRDGKSTVMFQSKWVCLSDSNFKRLRVQDATQGLSKEIPQTSTLGRAAAKVYLGN